jgi:lipoyl(octanoyl) transferase
VRHRHLRGTRPGGLLPYDEAHAAQEERRNEFLRWKGLKDAEREAAEVLRPTLISFEAEPTFTLGRRQEDLTDEQSGHLTRELKIRFQRREGLVEEESEPVVRRTQRGGMTTYHGPGQLVLWPVLDMHSPLYPPFSVSSYAHCLELTTQRLLSTLYGIETVTSEENPGVWVPDGEGRPARKVAALGVHHRRHITGLGTAVNVDIPTEGAEEDDMNPWARFEPCGLSSEGVTSLEREVKGQGGEVPGVWDLEELAGAWARLFEEALLDVTKR